MTEDEQVDYWELGFQLYSREPDLILADVWWRAGKLSAKQEDQFNFVFGYSTARRQRDDYDRERRDQTEGSSDHVALRHGDGG
jgi:hypothetical protein